VVVDVLDEQGRETVDRIQAAGGEAVFVSADVTRRDDVERLVRTAVKALGIWIAPTTTRVLKVRLHRVPNFIPIRRRSGIRCSSST
jgi:hypothetical protein